MVSSIIGASLLHFLWRWPKILLLIFWWSTAIGVDVVDMLQIIVVWHVFTVSHGSQSFVMFQGFSLLLELPKVEDIRLTKFCKIVVHFHDCLRLFLKPDECAMAQHKVL
jgi:hypothetical protein